MSCAKCFSPILSRTLIVVVQWPKFGHSTTLNNKGYKAHKEMGHVIMSFKCSINFHRAQNVLIRSNFGHCTTVTTINVWERIGEKHLAQLVGEGACQPDIFTKYRLGCELSYGTCPISLCAL